MSTTADSTPPAEPGATWRVLLEAARGNTLSAQEVKWLAEEASGRSAVELALELDSQPDLEVAASFATLVRERAGGQPLQHVLGHWSFRGLDLIVDRRALIPRPETEQLVDAALEQLAQSTDDGISLVADLGTGSGAIACALVSERDDVRVIATDVSEDALDLARENRARLERERRGRLELAAGDWYGALDEELLGALALIVSNPPYVAQGEWPGLDPVVRDFDPHGALVSGPTGTESIETILAGAPIWLRPGGASVIEIAPQQAERARQLAVDEGAISVEIRRDLAGRDRIVIATW